MHFASKMHKLPTYDNTLVIDLIVGMNLLVMRDLYITVRNIEICVK